MNLIRGLFETRPSVTATDGGVDLAPSPGGRPGRNSRHSPSDHLPVSRRFDFQHAARATSDYELDDQVDDRFPKLSAESICAPAEVLDVNEATPPPHQSTPGA
jgi:hypothetical protein